VNQEKGTGGCAARPSSLSLPNAKLAEIMDSIRNIILNNGWRYCMMIPKLVKLEAVPLSNVDDRGDDSLSHKDAKAI
jgi:hypothetical protein